MSEMRGYPNPNYDPQAIETKNIEMQVVDIHDCITLEGSEYRELVTKAAALDILTAHIKATGEISEDVIRAVTGTTKDAEKVPKSEADDYWKWYLQEKEETNKLRMELNKMGASRRELLEILRQNKIGPFAEDQGKKEGNE